MATVPSLPGTQSPRQNNRLCLGHGAWASLLFATHLAQALPLDWHPLPSASPLGLPDYVSEQPSQLTVPPSAASVPQHLAPVPGLLVEGVTFSGGSVFSDTQLQAVAAPFLGHTLDSGDLEDLRYRLTRLYVDQGYINSGAVLNGYDAATKRLHVQLKEGSLHEVRVKALNGASADYVAKRLRLAGAAPFHLPTLQERILLLLDDPVIASVRGAILPSTVPGQAILEAEAAGRKPYSLRLTLDNHGPVSLGEKRALMQGTLRNLAGMGELLTLGFDASDGNRRGLLDANVPLSAQDTRFHASFERGNAVVKEEPIELLDIKGDYTAYEFGLTHPVIQSLRRSLVLGLSLGWKSNKSSLLGIPFSFTQGEVNGRGTVVPVRFSQEWTERDTTQVYTLRSVLSLGLNALDATPTQGPVDARFVTWRAQQQYARQWWNRRLQLIGRCDLQLADSPLPVLEQVAVGGATSVRGYRENALIRDQVLLASLEVRYALLNSVQQGRYGLLQGALFSDFARGWNRGANAEGENLHSIGIGLLWSWHDDLHAQVYWGHPIKKPLHYTSYSLQDDGIHLQLQATY